MNYENCSKIKKKKTNLDDLYSLGSSHFTFKL